MPMAVSDLWQPLNGFEIRQLYSGKMSGTLKKISRYIQVLTFWTQLCYYILCGKFCISSCWWQFLIKRNFQGGKQNNNNKYAWFPVGSQSSTNYMYKYATSHPTDYFMSTNVSRFAVKEKKNNRALQEKLRSSKKAEM